MLLLDHSCEIQRNQTVGTNGRKEMSSLATDVPCLMLPMTAAASVQNNFSVGKAYDVFFDAGQDVNVGDKLLRMSRSYIVRAVQRYETPTAAHVHVMAEQETSS